MAPYNVASNSHQALCPPRHPTHFEPSPLEFNGPYDVASIIRHPMHFEPSLHVLHGTL